MAEFLLLFRGGDPDFFNQSPEQMQAQMEKWNQWMGGLAKQGKLMGSQPLEHGGKTVHGKKKAVVDGPFAEGKEVIGGYLICKADTIEEATEISKGCPILEHETGSVEVRAIRLM
jgi:hypothetical protein